MKKTVSVTEIRALIAKTPFFASLEDDVVDSLSQHARVRRLATGDILWRENNAALHLAILLNGKVKLIQSALRGDVVIDVALPGEVLGEVALSQGTTYATTVVCMRKAEVALVPMAPLAEMMVKDPQLAARLAFNLGAQIVRLYRRIGAMSVGSVESRLARVFSQLAERAGEPFPGGLLIPIRLTRQDIASMAATTLESTSRTITAWKARGILTPQPAGYVIRDLPRLQQIGGA